MSFCLESVWLWLIMIVKWVKNCNYYFKGILILDHHRGLGITQSLTTLYRMSKVKNTVKVKSARRARSFLPLTLWCSSMLAFDRLYSNQFATIEFNIPILYAYYIYWYCAQARLLRGDTVYTKDLQYSENEPIILFFSIHELITEMPPYLLFFARSALLFCEVVACFLDTCFDYFVFLIR